MQAQDVIQLPAQGVHEALPLPQLRELTLMA